MTLAATSALWSQDDLGASVRPHFDARGQKTEYVGPDSQKLAPESIAEVRIGYFGPSDPNDPQYGAMWRSALAAVERANRNGGFHGKPFRLIPAWSKDPWGTGVKKLTQLVYEQQVWAIVGGVDGPTTHLAEQVVAKARLPLISPVSTDKTVNLANVPWMFSIAPGDHLIAHAMAPQIAQSVGQKPFVLIAANDHDSFLLTRELRKSLAHLRVVPAYQFEFKPGPGQPNDDQRAPDAVDTIIKKSLSAKPVAVVVIAAVDDSVRLVCGLRRAGFDGCIFGGPSFARQRFVKQVGTRVGNTRFPLLAHGPAPAALAEPASNPLSRNDDFTARLTYDAVQLTITAIRRAGLSRTAIGREIRKLSPWQGTAGRVQWDGLGSNTRAVTIGTIRDQRLVPLH